MQDNEYSLWSRQRNWKGLVQECARLGVTLVAFSPLARGMLGEVPLRLDQVQDGFRAQNPRFMEPNFSRNPDRIAAFRSFCAARGWTVTATALAWLLARAATSSRFPGTRRAERLQQWLTLPELEGGQSMTEIERVLS